MYRSFALAGLMLAFLSAAARAEEANRYEIVLVPSRVPASQEKGEPILIDRQTGRTWTLATEFDATTFAPKESYWVPLSFKAVPAEEGKPFLPPN